MQLSIIIPVLNESAALPLWLEHLSPLRDKGIEIIVVDGGSQDDSMTIASHWGAVVVAANRGRAQQMNAGAAFAQGEVLLFLHADTTLPPDADHIIMAAMQHHKRPWGRFAVSIHGGSWMLFVVAFMMNRRSCFTGIATGDQAMFMTRKIFMKVAGFPDLPLMEDITLSKNLLALSRPICLSERVVTSGRRWEKGGVWRTILLMWRLRWAYWRGVPASELVKIYDA